MESEKIKRILKSYGENVLYKCEEKDEEFTCITTTYSEVLNLINKQEKEVAEKICQRLEKWGGHGTLYALEIRKEFDITKENK